MWTYKHILVSEEEKTHCNVFWWVRHVPYQTSLYYIRVNHLWKLNIAYSCVIDYKFPKLFFWILKHCFIRVIIPHQNILQCLSGIQVFFTLIHNFEYIDILYTKYGDFLHILPTYVCFYIKLLCVIDCSRMLPGLPDLLDIRHYRQPINKCSRPYIITRYHSIPACVALISFIWTT